MEQTFPLSADDSSATPLFSVPAVWATAGVALAAFVGFLVARVTDRSELLMPIDRNLQAAAIGVGVFAGIMLDAVLVAARQQGFRTPRSMSGLRIVIALVAVPLLCAMTATYAARRIVEYRAFHGLPIVTVPTDFTITGVHSSRSSRSLTLIGGVGQRTISLGITGAVYVAAHPGERLVLPVQTGREGVQRMIPPPRAITPGDLLP